jgi:hypothetical protein
MRRFRPEPGRKRRDVPNLAQLAPYLSTVDSETLFETGLEILLDGIEHRLHRSHATAPSTTAP